MNNKKSPGLRVSFISHSNHSYLSEYIKLSDADRSEYNTFENLNLLALRNFNPNIIIIDEYFKKKCYKGIIYLIKLNFKHTTIYFLSPEYANYNNIIQSANNKKHFYSSFSIDVFNKINMRNNENTNLLVAS